MWIARKRTPLSFPEIGREFERDHTTVMSACDKVERKLVEMALEKSEGNVTRAARLLNGLYLQAGLMVSRTHPAATNEGWFSGNR